MEYWTVVFPACEQGRLFVAKVLSSHELFLLCEECESAWLNPEKVGLNLSFDSQGLAIRRADSDDIKNSGWGHFIMTGSA
ncbi:hypothetical protein [Curvibacter gracilis]|uniref:hypothetical protein n=1 Tax=Curvibacter gracilis TaxID=230310 RepID=UPI0012FC586E|nr:hypothetical protein [Curvibacter gracilis]